MIVRYWMTPNPLTIKAQVKLDEALEIMRGKKVRRLPVMEGEQLVGVVSLSDLFRYFAPQMASKALISKEDTDKLSALTVAHVMTPSPFTCTPNTALEDVGRLMREKKVGALPVLETGRVVGIITESDVLAAIVTIAGAGLQGQRICFRIPVERRREIFFEVVDLCRLHGLDLLTLLSHPIQGESDHLVTIRVEGGKISELMKVFYRRKYRVLLIKE